MDGRGIERPRPEEYQPPLRWWGHVWRLLLCVVISAVLVILVAYSLELPDVDGDGPTGSQWALDVALGVLGLPLVLLRRRYPVTVAVVLGVASAVSLSVAGPATLALMSVATRRRVRELVLPALVTMAAAMIYPRYADTPVSSPVWIDFGFNIAFVVALLALGLYVGSRRELLWTLRQRAERAEIEQEERLTGARTTERARIAREMHDVLAHRISQVSMHAGALAFREDLTADQMRESAGVIQQKANEALTDLRGVLGVLRDPDTGELTSRPQPSVTEVPALIAEARESGMNVSYDPALPEEEMPLVVGRTVYRIIQEGLTNAAKHAPGALVSVTVTGSPDDGVTVELRNPLGFGHLPTAPGAGLGLVGLTERAELRGGRLEHRRDGTTFVLRGWIPWSP